MSVSNKKVAIVTGAGQGIGFEIVKTLLADGVCVVMNDIQDEIGRKAYVNLETSSEYCLLSIGDVSDPIYIDSLVQLALSHFGRLDYVVANAGITLFGDFLTYPANDLEKVLRLNLFGTFMLIQSGAKAMVRQGEGGRVVLMSSVTGHQAHSGLAAYGMTKAALEMLAKALVIDLAPHKITVNSIAPGATLTERTQADVNYASIWSGLTPLGRPATTLDIAYAVKFFLSDGASHITGQNLIVDGGWTVTSPNPPSN